MAEVRKLEQGTDRLVLQADLSGLSAAHGFDHFTRPDLLVRGWPPEAHVEAHPGGWYHLAWPAQNWHLRGRFTIFEPGRSLAFTWQWDHEPEQRLRHVAIDFAGHVQGGCLLTLTHALYDDGPTEQAQRDSHRDGWRHFLGRLADLNPPEVSVL